jgi:hypothetical protein
MFTVFGAADVPIARTLGRLIGGAGIFGGVGAVLVIIRNLFVRNS